MSQSTDLRTRLENAVRLNQQNQQRIKIESNISKPVPVQQPSIKLKTDFSNFS